MSMKTIRNSSVEGGCDCSYSNLYAKADAHLVSRTSILTNIYCLFDIGILKLVTNVLIISTFDFLRIWLIKGNPLHFTNQQQQVSQTHTCSFETVEIIREKVMVRMHPLHIESACVSCLYSLQIFITLWIIYMKHPSSAYYIHCQVWLIPAHNLAHHVNLQGAIQLSLKL